MVKIKVGQITNKISIGRYRVFSKDCVVGAKCWGGCKSLDVYSINDNVDKLWLFKTLSFDQIEVCKDIINSGLVNGCRLVLICDKNNVAHITWYSVSANSAVFDSIFSLNIYQETDFGFIGPCLTNREYRGKGLYPLGLSTALSNLGSFGKKRALISCRESNIPSLRGIAKSGFIPFRTIILVRFLKLNFIYEEKISM